MCQIHEKEPVTQRVLMHPKPVMVSYLPVLLRVNHKKGSWAYFFFKFSNQTNHFFLMSLVLCKGQLAFVNPSILVIKGIHMLRKKWIFFLCFGHSTVAVAFLKKLWNPKKERNDNSQVLAAHGVVFINHHPKFFQDFSVQVPLDPSLLSSLCLHPIAWCISELAEDASVLAVHVTIKNVEEYHVDLVPDLSGSCSDLGH